MRRIDADDFIEEMEKLYHDHGWDDEDVHFSLNDLKGNIDVANTYEQRTVESEVIMCKDCIHRPIIDDPDATDGFGLQFPDFKCPCRCDDPYYSWMPNDNWFCGNGEKEKKTNERES